jgi:hypothetical protein
LRSSAWRYLLLARIMRRRLDIWRRGCDSGGNNSLLRLRLAEAYHALNRDQEARKQIDFMLKMTPNPNYLPEYKEAVEQAKKLEEKIA